MATLAVQLSEPELKLLQTLIYEQCGMYFDDRRTHFLEDRLHRRLRACRMESFYSYYRLLTSRDGRTELSALLENLTVNETSFWRNQPQLELFHKTLLDKLFRRKHAARDFSIKMWSAGCSTGQEPYTMAMLTCDALAFFLLRHTPMAQNYSPKPMVPLPWRLQIVASDISYAALRTAQEGVYSGQQIAPVDSMYRLRYFDRVGENYRVKEALKQVVQFDFHNLKTEYLPQCNDVIFCRNVMIYFDAAEQKRLVDKLWRCLNPGGSLLIGHAETLYGISDRFRMVHLNHGTAYERIDEFTTDCHGSPPI
ncbi:MAG: CheR family methyltransferase [Terriglobales bacterium]